MKRLAYLVVVVLFALLLIPAGQVFAQKSPPKVPITYPGDTDETIVRRARWIEGAKKGMPGDWSRVNPVPVTGPSYTLQRRASHPNAARLSLEWLFSPQGLVAYEKITYYGAIYPGSGTRLAKVLQGSTFVYRTEEVDLKATELGLEKKFSQLLGITP